MILSSRRFLFDQSQCRSFDGLPGAHSVRCLDQFAQLRDRVMIGDIPGGVSQQHLARLRTD